MDNKINKIINNLLLVLVILGIFVMLPNKKSTYIVKTNFNNYVSFLNSNQLDVKIETSIGSFDTFKDEVNKLYTNQDIEFVITENNPVTNIKYHVANDLVEDLSTVTFTDYIDEVTLTDEDIYVIYVSYEDSNNEVKYVNTDKLYIDKTKPEIEINIEGNTYTDYNEPVTNVVLVKDNLVEIIDNDLSKIKEVLYFISEDDLNENDLSLIPVNEWQQKEEIRIMNSKFKILYLKVEDNAGNIGYFKTDNFRVSKYTQKAFVGYDKKELDLKLTTDSIVVFDFKHETEYLIQENIKHNLISSFVFEKNTIITLINNKTNKVYQYKVEDSELDFGFDDNEYATYPFDIFKDNSLVDSALSESLFESDDMLHENFTVILDFTKTTGEERLNNTLKLELLKDNDEVLISTFNKDLKKYNLYEDKNAELDFKTDINDREIEYNTNSTTVINLESEVLFKKKSGDDIFDPKLNNTSQAVTLKLVDSNNKVVSKNMLSSIVVKLGHNVITPSDDGVYYIKFSNDLNKAIKQISILTFQNNGGLEEGEYRFEISSYISKDGYFNSKLLDPKIVNIPVHVSYDELNIDYSFGLVENNPKIVIKDEEVEEVTFNYELLQNGNIEFPNIQVALYKKKELTAFNQEYEIVDLIEYVNNTLVKSQEDTYYVTSDALVYSEEDPEVNNFRLDFLPNEMENTSYKVVFGLYDGEKLIAEVSKYFIVREK